MSEAACWCGSDKPFAQCCAPLLKGEQRADGAEQLMRSRYSAFCTHNAKYLLATHDPATRPAGLEQSLQQSFASTRWLGLRILKAVPAQAGEKTARVEFVAFFKTSDREDSVQQVHENSSFILAAQDAKESWLYTAGEHLLPIKLERNGPCICGSGRKFKKCCA